MKSSRRHLTFSLRSLFVVLTALGVWLGVAVNKGLEQREAVQAIEALGGKVLYDWQAIEPSANEPRGPAWLRRLIGDDFFQDAWQVDFGSPIIPNPIDLWKTVPYLQQMRTLRRIRLFTSSHVERQDELKAALPNCDLQIFYVDNAPGEIPIDKFFQ